jgi:transposase InsO family protein
MVPGLAQPRLRLSRLSCASVGRLTRADGCPAAQRDWRAWLQGWTNRGQRVPLRGPASPRRRASKCASRRRLSNTMDVTFCTEALEGTLARHGKSGIFNTDQGSQFTSLSFTQVLMDAGIWISMNGRGRWMDNVFIERLWRSLEYECVYLHAFETGLALHLGLLRWIDHYNTRRPHSTLARRTPNEAYNKTS